MEFLSVYKYRKCKIIEHKSETFIQIDNKFKTYCSEHKSEDVLALKSKIEII